MKYFIAQAQASFVGTEAEWKTKVDDNVNPRNIEDYFYELGVEHIEGYEDTAEYEEENGVEYEYNVCCYEVSEKEYNNSEAQEVVID